MCGITGLLRPDGAASRETLERTALAMADELAHRGPDDRGAWADERCQIAFGHRRLSIIDLSTDGQQPMTSADGRWVITFNGEVYNHRELRADLEREGVAFRGHSDTEVLLEASARWGPHEAVRRSVGMFAYALWSVVERELILVRDRIGEKPLYYGRAGGAFVFGSELKALRRHPEWSGRVDAEAVGWLLRLGYIPGQRSIYEGVRKVPPGALLVVDARGGHGEPRAYWSLAEAVEQGAQRVFPGDRREAADELELRIRQSIRGQMMADVPLGAFLSSGVDSSTLVALMQTESSVPVRTFTIGVEDPALDESRDAAAIAAYLGTDHTEMRVTHRDALEVIPRIPRMFDEPMADYSQIPTHLVAKLTRQHVTVSLSADGGDELFGGYNTYLWVLRYWPLLRAIPRRLRSFGSRILHDVLARHVAGRPSLSGARLVHRGLRATELAPAAGPDALFVELARHWRDEDRPLVGRPLPSPDPAPPPPWLDDHLARMCFRDAATYLPDDVLVKVDRASMAVGLESRAPLLDHRVVELAFSFPSRMKVGGGRSKRVLRDVLGRHVPSELTDRPKKGFAVPMGTWLRGPLRQWAEDLLSPSRLRRDGWLDERSIRRKWEEHVTGARDWKFLLWDALTFQAWLAEER